MDSKPFISIVVPVRNEERHIMKCLSSLINQDYQGSNYEILIVDGMSEDGTIREILDFTEQFISPDQLPQNRGREQK